MEIAFYLVLVVFRVVEISDGCHEFTLKRFGLHAQVFKCSFEGLYGSEALQARSKEGVNG